MDIKDTDKIAFQIYKIDNVVTALSDIKRGKVTITGETENEMLDVLEDISGGHKIAVRDIKSGESIIKYGVPIGTATKDIKKGTWVHLHCMKSNYDERSNHLDLHTGVPIDSEY